jgi:hypothetical protein
MQRTKKSKRIMSHDVQNININYFKKALNKNSVFEKHKNYNGKHGRISSRTKMHI